MSYTLRAFFFKKTPSHLKIQSILLKKISHQNVCFEAGNSCIKLIEYFQKIIDYAKNYARAISWTPSLHNQSSETVQFAESVTSSRLRNINLIPIDFGFHLRLRGRLTLRWLPSHRNPWIFGDTVSHSIYVTYVSILTSHTSTDPPGSASSA